MHPKKTESSVPVVLPDRRVIIQPQFLERRAPVLGHARNTLEPQIDGVARGDVLFLPLSEIAQRNAPSGGGPGRG